MSWFFPKKYNTPVEQIPLWEYSEEPKYVKEHRETKAIIEDILVKIDEIKAIVNEMKEKEIK